MSRKRRLCCLSMPQAVTAVSCRCSGLVSATSFSCTKLLRNQHSGCMPLNESTKQSMCTQLLVQQFHKCSMSTVTPASRTQQDSGPSGVPSRASSRAGHVITMHDYVIILGAIIAVIASDPATYPLCTYKLLHVNLCKSQDTYNTASLQVKLGILQYMSSQGKLLVSNLFVSSSETAMSRLTNSVHTHMSFQGGIKLAPYWSCMTD